MHKIHVPALALVPTLAATLVLAQEDLPPLVEALRLTEVEVVHAHERHGRDIAGTLPGGARIEIDFDRTGAVEDIEARDRDGFPAAEVAAAVPEAVRASPDYPADARFDELELHDDGRVEIEGVRADGREFEAEFAASGQLLEMKLD
jgi:hypothetical protein